MVIRPKHYALGIFDFLFSYWLYSLNLSWGNPISRCIILSVFTFILLFLSFDVYWELRDFWQYRWYRVNLVNLSITPISIIVNSKYNRKTDSSFTLEPSSNNLIKKNKKIIKKKQKKVKLHGELLQSKESTENTPLVIFTHGFSDNRKYIRHYTTSIALSGLDVFSYDCRGTGNSKNAGKKSQFIEIINDLGEIIDFFKSDSKYSKKKIYLVGLSLGAMASIYQGLKKNIEKIVAIGAMADYRKNLPISPITFKGKWWIWLRYSLFNVPFNPPDSENFILSPYLQIKEYISKLDNSNDLENIISKRLFLLHAKNDKVIPFKNFELNKNISEIPQTHYLLTPRGGHNFLKYELDVVAYLISALKY